MKREHITETLKRSEEITHAIVLWSNTYEESITMILTLNQKHIKQLQCVVFREG